MLHSLNFVINCLKDTNSLCYFVKLVGGVGRLVPVRVPLLHLGLVRRLDLLHGGPAVHAQHAVRLELGGERGLWGEGGEEEEGEEEEEGGRV